MEYPIQNQKLFDKILPLANRKKCKCQVNCKDIRDDVEFYYFEFKIYDKGILKAFFTYMTPIRNTNLSDYLLYNIADISHGQGYHTCFYIDELGDFYMQHL